MIGFRVSHDGGLDERRQLRHLIDLQLVATGLRRRVVGPHAEFAEIARGLLDHHLEMARLLTDHRCPADQRIEAFLAEHLGDLGLDQPIRLPGTTFRLDRHGVARELSLPVDGDHFQNDLVDSYRLKNGVLHNPKHDRRTTKGTFHVAEGGLPIPNGKKAVPKRVFAEMLRIALAPPRDSMILPYTAGQDDPAHAFVSLLLRPVVCPEVAGVCPRKTLEVRFFAPGSLVSNLDFVESIFGNAGDPSLPENDAGLDVEHWTGHTGCVILAPHLVNCTKKQLGLPHADAATDRQKADGMCWTDETERYNDGGAFKLTCRTDAGVMVTLIADNYFGYCKKEVKTQISYAANLYGNVEEEHAGGALAFASYNLGEDFQADSQSYNGRTFDDVARDYADQLDVRPEGYAVDKTFPELIYVPEDAYARVRDQTITWTRDGQSRSIALAPGKVYITPSGYKFKMEKHPAAPSWRLIGTIGEGVFCHKPCTVSGGGKSEISKSLDDYMLYGPLFVSDIEADLNLVEQVFKKDYSTRFRPGIPDYPDYSQNPSRPVLSPKRSLGSVIKLLTPARDYTDEYNAWLETIPNYVYALIFIIKRFYKPEWGEDWRIHFSVDIVNGFPGHELKYEDRKLVGTYLRVGLLEGQQWRTFKVRQDFSPAQKVQTEDDISASVVVPSRHARHTHQAQRADACKFSTNCEYRLFQRPDDAIHRGLDQQTEIDLARHDNFISNFQPLTVDDVQQMVAHVAEFSAFTEPMRRLLTSAAQADAGYVVSSSNPRIVDGKPTKNPRYLQTRPDLVDPLNRHVAEVGVRLSRGISADEPLHLPVNAVLLGRRNNPPDLQAGIRALAVYNPIHYQELPELFMDFICSLTGKSPSTTGAGSEGALTKGPFNALLPTSDLNNALVSFILTGLGGFSTSAGHIGPDVAVGHDISLLVPEIWCRLHPDEREPDAMIRRGWLEPLEDFEHKGQPVLASRLGYRITATFIREVFGRVFDNPSKVFNDAILQPETQGLDVFADGVWNITEAQERVAQAYFEDGSIDHACPPLKALLSIMANGSYDGKDARHPDIRAMFTRDALLSSDWYRQRLVTKQRRDLALWKRHAAYLDDFLNRPNYADRAAALDIPARKAFVDAEIALVEDPAYLDDMVGAIGADPL